MVSTDPAAPDRSVTLEDVAALAGVHPSTVSRAVSRPDLVNARTLERVSAAIEQLGYVPNRAARELAGGTTSTIAMLVPDLVNPFFAGVVHAAQSDAAAAGRLLVLAETAQDVSTELHAVRSLAPNVDGLVLCSPIAPSGEILRAARGRQLLFVNRQARDVPSVVVDQRAIAQLALDHLAALGHRRIGFVHGPLRYWSSRQRIQAARTPQGTLVLELRNVAPTFEAGRELFGTVRRVRMTAVAAFNDVMALGLLAEATAHGVRVPEDLSIVGADGVEFGAMVTPPLTTVAVDLDALGAAAIGALLAHLESGRGTAAGARSVAAVETLEPRLVVRGSTAAPPDAQEKRR